MACDCIETFGEKLREHNTRLCLTFGIPRDGSPMYHRPTIQVEKIETRKRVGPVIALPSFCPFCGERYEPAPALPAPVD
jgi:hypothetical protein